MFDGWLALAGTELINNERCTVYAEKLGVAGVGCSPCPDLHVALGDAPYVAPDADDAPWYDEHFPASARFAGFLGMGIDGTGGTGQRSPVQMREGSMVGSMRRGQRELAVTCLAVAADDEALSYGIGWLAAALRGSVCVTCRGDNLCCFAACPTGNGDDQVRSLMDVGLLEGPVYSDLARLGASCEGPQPGVIATVEYTLVAGLPYFYREPQLVRLPDLVAVTGIVDPPEDCPEAGPCPPDPTCTQPGARPTAPTPTNTCECTFTDGVGSVLQVPAAAIGRWVESVPVLSIYTGATDMRCVRVRFFRNPYDLPCDVVGGQDPCQFCDEFGVSWIPAGAVFTVDGRRKQVSLDCSSPGGPTYLGPYLYASPGKAFSWPVFDCPGGMCIEFMAAQADAKATVSIGLAAREDAA